MNAQIAITSDERRIIEHILQDTLSTEANVWVFGSRAHPSATIDADLDLLVDANRPLTLAERSRLESSFEFSLLSYRVDVVDAHRISGIFAENALRDRVLIWPA